MVWIAEMGKGKEVGNEGLLYPRPRLGSAQKKGSSQCLVTPLS